MINNIQPDYVNTVNYTTAMDSFMNHMNKNCNSNGYYRFTVNKGRKYDKVVSNSSNGGDMMTSSRSVHCFVGKETGHIFKPAGWNAPQLKTHTPVRGSIYEIDSYRNAEPHGGWLYLR